MGVPKMAPRGEAAVGGRRRREVENADTRAQGGGG